MSALDPIDHTTLDHVLVLAPYRRDADYLKQLFVEHDIPVDVCIDVAEIQGYLARSPGVLVATHEALTPDILKNFAALLASQPRWS